MTETQRCRVKSSWKQVGKATYKLPVFVYRVPILPGTRCVEHLGKVKERSDGRWDWWRKRSNYHKNWNGEGQGVERSRGNAEVRVLEGWSDEPDEPKVNSGVSIDQILHGGPWPTYILKWGESMPPDVLKALQEGEAALLLDIDGRVKSMVVYNEIVGMREMSVETMREHNRRNRNG